MEMDFVTLTQENLDSEQLCCIVRTKKPHPGVERKRAWLRERIREGHVFRKLTGNDCAFIEYAPIETAWAPVEGEDYLYLYCLWVQGAPRGQGVGKALMESCLQDARAKGKAGVCMLGAEKQKAWLSDQRFAEKFGFQTVDTAGEYRPLRRATGAVLCAECQTGDHRRKRPHNLLHRPVPVHCPENRKAARVLRDARDSGSVFPRRNAGAGEGAAVPVQ